MSKRITLTDEEVQFFLEYVEQQLHHASTDPGRGVLAKAALERIQDKLQAPTGGFALHSDGTVTSDL